MNHLDDIDRIRLSALRAVWKPDTDAIIRRICRWYSKEYHTPLADVPDLPLDDILQAWFESNYENLEPEERHNMAISLLETPDEREKRKMTDGQSEDNFIRQSEALAAKQKARKKLPSKLADIQAALKKSRIAEKEAKSAPDPQPEITVSYDDSNLTDEDGDGIALPTKRKK